MRVLTLYAPAKVNLTLDIKGKRADGYHDIDSIFQSVTVFDDVTLRLSDNIKVTTSMSQIADDETNLAYRAATAFAKAVSSDIKAEISIKKRIPTEAGLGGGSSDAAAVLVGLNELTNSKLTKSELCEIGATLGADVPFCILGGTKRASGIGTEFADAPKLNDGLFAIIKPSFGISSKEAYARWDDLNISQRGKTDDMINALASADLRSIGNCMSNSFEYAMPYKDELWSIKERIMQCGAVGCCMTGSGSAVVGLFDMAAKREIIKENCKDLGAILFAVPTYQGAVIAGEKII